MMTHKKIRNIPKDRTVTYARMVVDDRPQKPYPNQICITSREIFIKYPGELTTQTENLTISKILWNSVLRTQDAKYMCIVKKTFTLATHWIDMSTCASH